MLLEAKGLSRSYLIGQTTIPILRGVDISVAEGEFISIMGTSGSGKSTLLHILGGLDTPDHGTYIFNGKDMLSMSDIERSGIRAHWIGFVFQTFDLLPELNVVENISLPFLYNKTAPDLKNHQIKNAMERVGLMHRQMHRPQELSGGEMQRVAIARALAVNPKLILADEPTGNLDSRNSHDILNLFRDLNESGATVIMVTHDEKVAAFSERTLEMADGCLS
ncbi:ABC-type antimicrobial peptide transport system, ATPase component [Desulfocapsa sulfexigens DSM 10523]|uniref:ABC-type antimicrobial peptide transport system, ATPase component n=1 Tax=Desulfocapsa sulfexigens (strain DSM 10523 / SB164P1) TaxID=1167006 RepID=M1NHD5_DESSD|nr:ABC transporter ATP-binding protein [Desulfocapsa sulfexigens]AGF79014.1 ABC-type antimicrobial peptide transport system, ATPase component [Desulfocapsa sulfexigens DSM 10523]